MSDYLPSILSSAYECEECGAECEAGITYDPEMRERVDCWRCPSCGAKFYRDEGDGVRFHGVARVLGRR